MTSATQIDTRLTPAAEAFIRRLFRFSAGPEAGFRLKVVPGGCSGYATEFDLVRGPDAGAFVWEYEGCEYFSTRTAADYSTAQPWILSRLARTRD